jgi:hypothetical protein
MALMLDNVVLGQIIFSEHFLVFLVNHQSIKAAFALIVNDWYIITFEGEIQNGTQSYITTSTHY